MIFSLFFLLPFVGYGFPVFDSFFFAENIFRSNQGRKKKNFPYLLILGIASTFETKAHTKK